MGIFLDVCGSEQVQLFAGTRSRDVEQAPGLLIFPLRLLLAYPPVDTALLAVTADGSNHELALLLLRLPDQPGLLYPAKQRLLIRPCPALQSRDDYDVKTKPLCLVDGH